MSTAHPAADADLDLGGVRSLSDGWELAPSSPDAEPDRGELDGLEWRPATVPGTVAGALGLDPTSSRDLDDEDWWFRLRFAAEPAAVEEEVVLCLDGIATVAEVRLNRELLLESESMFVAHELDVGPLLGEDNELVIRCRALAPLLKPRRRPRARWRTRLVEDGNLRFFRTMLIGRAPGFAPGPAAVGPWREVRLERRTGYVAEGTVVRTHLDGDAGVLTLAGRLRALGGPLPSEGVVELSGPSGVHRAAVEIEADGGNAALRARLRVAGVARWWPHTHGEPALHEVRLLLTAGASERAVPLGRVGFRTLAAGSSPDHDLERDGLDLHVNGEPVFARGALWTPLDVAGLNPPEAELRAALERVSDAGMNMLRIPGTGAPETSAFHDLCDELGIMLWQDFAFANLDYPINEGAFRGLVEAEASQLLERLAPRPSLAVLCGNSEVEQQVAMLGLDPALGRGELFGRLLPALVAAAGTDAVYVPSAPCGGERPLAPERGVSNYFGVGGYRRPLEDARRAEVRFASECLALSNVPCEATIASIPPGSSTPDLDGPGWKSGVPRDAGADWDFEDVRDHYLRLLFELDPLALRRSDPERYLELSRAASGIVMAETFGEWRRGASPCRGGLVLWLSDLLPGAGWGLLDSAGKPKVALHHLRRVLAPVAVWTTDEGLGGVAIHVANERERGFEGRLRVALYRDLEVRIEEAEEVVSLAPREVVERSVEGLIGRFVDSSYAYRFGPPPHDAIVVSLELEAGGATEVVSQSMRFPAGRPIEPLAADDLGLEAAVVSDADCAVRLEVRSRRLAYGVRVHCDGYEPSDDAFCVEPGGTRVIGLRRRDQPPPGPVNVRLSALNLGGTIEASHGGSEEKA